MNCLSLFIKIQNCSSSCSSTLQKGGLCWWCWRHPKGEGVMLFPCAAAAGKSAHHLPALKSVLTPLQAVLYLQQVSFCRKPCGCVLPKPFENEIYLLSCTRIQGWAAARMKQVVRAEEGDLLKGGDAQGSGLGLLYCCWSQAGIKRERWDFGNFLAKAEKLGAMLLVLSASKSQMLCPGCLPWNGLSLLCEVSLIVSEWLSENET